MDATAECNPTFGVICSDDRTIAINDKLQLHIRNDAVAAAYTGSNHAVYRLTVVGWPLPASQITTPAGVCKAGDMFREQKLP